MQIRWRTGRLFPAVIMAGMRSARARAWDDGEQRAFLSGRRGATMIATHASFSPPLSRARRPPFLSLEVYE